MNLLTFLTHCLDFLKHLYQRVSHSISDLAALLVSNSAHVYTWVIANSYIVAAATLTACAVYFFFIKNRGAAKSTGQKGSKTDLNDAQSEGEKTNEIEDLKLHIAILEKKMDSIQNNKALESEKFNEDGLPQDYTKQPIKYNSEAELIHKAPYSLIDKLCMTVGNQSIVSFAKCKEPFGNFYRPTYEIGNMKACYAIDESYINVLLDYIYTESDKFALINTDKAPNRDRAETKFDIHFTEDEYKSLVIKDIINKTASESDIHENHVTNLTQIIPQITHVLSNRKMVVDDDSFAIINQTLSNSLLAIKTNLESLKSSYAHVHLGLRGQSAFNIRRLWNHIANHITLIRGIFSEHLLECRRGTIENTAKLNAYYPHNSQDLNTSELDSPGAITKPLKQALGEDVSRIFPGTSTDSSNTSIERTHPLLKILDMSIEQSHHNASVAHDGYKDEIYRSNFSAENLDLLPQGPGPRF